jgi:serine/threonine protein kinase/formylglycine-generating enzyme required for sulfatase activity
MPVRLQCPNPDCNGSFSAPESDAPRFRLCPQCGWELSVLGSSEPKLAGAGGSPLLASSNEPALSKLTHGTTFARRYTIIKPLGRGGMGAVYLANDTELEREVALKIPFLLDDDDPEFRQRFRREARAAARLSHANICAIFDVGEHEGQPYITMAYVEGILLSEFIKQRTEPLDPAEAARLVRKLAQTLEFAHQRGVVHRDLKPANIMLNDVAGPILMDFGLARREDRQDSLRTRAGQQLGTPAYMPIEQFQGRMEAIGPRSDIYSLGVILFELLTGRRPFEGNAFEIHLKVLRSDTPSPSSIRAGLNPVLDQICKKAMARNSQDRYGSMHELEQALKAITNLAPRDSSLNAFFGADGRKPNDRKSPALIPLEGSPKGASERQREQISTPAEKKSSWKMKGAISLVALAAVGSVVAILAPRFLSGPRGPETATTNAATKTPATSAGDSVQRVASAPTSNVRTAEGAESKSAPEKVGGSVAADVSNGGATPQNVSGPAKSVVSAGSPGLVFAPEGLLLRSIAESSDWERLDATTALAAGNRLLCLATSRAVIMIGKGKLTMVGECELRILDQAKDQAPAVELMQGRLIIPTQSACSLKIRLGDRFCTLKVPQNGGAALERPANWVYGQRKYPVPPLVIYSTAGDITVSVGSKEEKLSSFGALSVDLTGVKRLTIATSPTWAKEMLLSPNEIKAREQFAKALHSGRTILTEIVEALNSGNRENADLSIRALLSMDQVSQLVQALSRQNVRVVRRGALEAIRSCIARGPGALAAVRAQLVAVFGEKASVVEKLLIGFSSDEASRPQFFKQIVELLYPDYSVAVRELALDNLTELTGRDDLGYDPDHPTGPGLSAWVKLARQEALVLKPDELRSESTGMVLIRVGPNDFQMGSSKADVDAEEIERPQHLVQFTRPYYLGKYEVTQAEYQAVVGANPSHFNGNPRLPVENVSWLDAIQFCNQMSERDGLARFYEIAGEDVRVAKWNAPGYRLPTEAEWEYACRARIVFELADDQENLKDHAWFSANSEKRTHDVGLKQRNAFGFYDMRGNVSEWCWDWFDYYPKDDDVVKDPRGGDSSFKKRITRGGGWSDDEALCRPAHRYTVKPMNRTIDLGFRLARSGQMPGATVPKTAPK